MTGSVSEVFIISYYIITNYLKWFVVMCDYLYSCTMLYVFVLNTFVAYILNKITQVKPSVYNNTFMVQVWLPEVFKMILFH